MMNLLTVDMCLRMFRDARNERPIHENRDALVADCSARCARVIW